MVERTRNRRDKRTLPVPLLILLLTAPLLAGCTFLDPPDKDRTEGFQVTGEVYKVPELDLRIEHRFGFIRGEGAPTLALPVTLSGEEVGAVYLDAALRWRIDAYFNVRERDAAGDVFLLGPVDGWAEERARQGWQPASDADLRSEGLGSMADALERARKPVPGNVTKPAPGLWTLNGTLSAQVRPENFTMALEEGPFVFQRNDTGMLVVEGRTVINWNSQNQSLDVAQDALLNGRVLDPDLATVDLTWSDQRVDVRVTTPPFRRSDLIEDDDTVARIIALILPDVAQITMIKYTGKELTDNRATVTSANMTLVLGP